MYRRFICRKIFLRIISQIVSGPFFFNTIFWAVTDKDLCPAKYSLQVQSISNPILRDAGRENYLQVRSELLHGLSLILRDRNIPFHDINSGIDRWYHDVSASDGPLSKGRILDAQRPIRAENSGNKDGREIIFKFRRGTNKGSLLKINVSSFCETLGDIDDPAKVRLEFLPGGNAPIGGAVNGISDDYRDNYAGQSRVKMYYEDMLSDEASWGATGRMPDNVTSFLKEAGDPSRWIFYNSEMRKYALRLSDMSSYELSETLKQTGVYSAVDLAALDAGGLSDIVGNLIFAVDLSEESYLRGHDEKTLEKAMGCRRNLAIIREWVYRHWDPSPRPKSRFMMRKGNAIYQIVARIFGADFDDTTRAQRQGTFDEVKKFLPRLKEKYPHVETVYLTGVWPIGEYSGIFNTGEADREERVTKKEGGDTAVKVYVFQKDGKAIAVGREEWPGDPERYGSPFSIDGYLDASGGAGSAALRVAPDLGTSADFNEAVRSAHSLGLKIVVDFIPNHVSVSSPLIGEHPEWFVHRPLGKKATAKFNKGKYSELLGEYPDDFFLYRCENYKGQGERVLAVRYGHWMGNLKDCAQLNYADPGLRAYMTGVLKAIASSGVDGVRCDLAASALKKHVYDRFYRKAGTAREERRFNKRVPEEFWRETIREVKKEHPDFRFIAEVYGEDEEVLQEEGFDLTYLKHMLDIAVYEDTYEMKDLLARMDAGYFSRSVIFAENHDEVGKTAWEGGGRIASRVGDINKLKALLTVLFTVPGTPLVYHGQLEGDIRSQNVLKLLPEYAGESDEERSSEIHGFYGQILDVTAAPEFRDGSFRPLGTARPGILKKCSYTQREIEYLINVLIQIRSMPGSAQAVIAAETRKIGDDEKHSGLNLERIKYALSSVSRALSGKDDESGVKSADSMGNALIRYQKWLLNPVVAYARKRGGRCSVVAVNCSREKTEAMLDLGDVFKVRRDAEYLFRDKLTGKEFVLDGKKILGNDGSALVTLDPWQAHVFSVAERLKKPGTRLLDGRVVSARELISWERLINNTSKGPSARMVERFVREIHASYDTFTEKDVIAGYAWFRGSFTYASPEERLSWLFYLYALYREKNKGGEESLRPARHFVEGTFFRNVPAEAGERIKNAFDQMDSMNGNAEYRGFISSLEKGREYTDLEKLSEERLEALLASGIDGKAAAGINLALGYVCRVLGLVLDAVTEKDPPGDGAAELHLLGYSLIFVNIGREPRGEAAGKGIKTLFGEERVRRTLTWLKEIGAISGEIDIDNMLHSVGRLGVASNVNKMYAATGYMIGEDDEYWYGVCANHSFGDHGAGEPVYFWINNGLAGEDDEGYNLKYGRVKFMTFGYKMEKREDGGYEVFKDYLTFNVAKREKNLRGARIGILPITGPSDNKFSRMALNVGFAGGEMVAYFGGIISGHEPAMDGEDRSFAGPLHAFSCTDMQPGVSGMPTLNGNGEIVGGAIHGGPPGRSLSTHRDTVFGEMSAEVPEALGRGIRDTGKAAPPASVRESYSKKGDAGDPDRRAEKKLTGIDHAAGLELNSAGRYLAASGTPVNIVIDLSLVSRRDLGESMKTWACLIGLCHKRGLNSVNFIFEYPAISGRRYAPVSSPPRVTAGPDAVTGSEAVEALRGNMEEMRALLGIDDVGVFFAARVNNRKDSGAVEVHIASKRWLEYVRDKWQEEGWTRDEKKDLMAARYHVAMETPSVDDSDVPFHSFRAALAIALAEACLAAARERDEASGKTGEKELPKLKEELLKGLNSIYKILIGREIDITAETMDAMIDESPVVRVETAISIALPPAVRVLAAELIRFHEIENGFIYAA